MYFAIYKHYHNCGNLTSQEFIILFGMFELFLSQIPGIHPLMENSVCTFSTVEFALYDGTCQHLLYVSAYEHVSLSHMHLWFGLNLIFGHIIFWESLYQNWHECHMIMDDCALAAILCPESLHSK